VRLIKGQVLYRDGPFVGTTIFTYDNASRLLSSSLPPVQRHNGTAAFSGRVLTATIYDPNGNATMVTDPRGSTTVTSYDALNRATHT